MKNSNPIVLRSGTNIGVSAAEADNEFLFQCFVDHQAIAQLQDFEDGRFFASGRTGSGKTAILRMIEKNNPNVSVVDVFELAVSYVANSTIMQFLAAVDVDLDIIFQALWKHVLCIEFIRLKYSVTSTEESKSWFQRLRLQFESDERKKVAIQYLQDWEGRFWITMDENIKEITQKIEHRVQAELGAEVAKFNASAGYARSLSKEKKSAIVATAKRLVDQSMLVELNKVLVLLEEYDDNNRMADGYYILIDRLDEKWVDEAIRYQLIRALIECLRSFGKIRNLKIVVAIRSDVLDRVVQESSHAGFQREKYDDYFLTLRWTDAQLRELIDKRINFLFRKKYSKEQLFFSDVFDRKVGNMDSFKYMLERTLLRPRDIIQFVNVCLAQSEGKSKVPQGAIRRAESEYSRVRLQALTEEWESAFPSLKIAFEIIAKRGKRLQAEHLFLDDFVTEFAVRVSENIDHPYDPICDAIRRFSNENSTLTQSEITRLLLAEMYSIGAIGLKLSQTEPF